MSDELPAKKFSPEGRLYQVEYAMETVSYAGSCVGIVAEDGVLLAVEDGGDTKLRDTTVVCTGKLFQLSNDTICAMSGVAGDCLVLTTELQDTVYEHIEEYGEQMPCEELVRHLASIIQSYTQYGTYRPFAVSALYIGWDERYGYQLFHSDPSGSYYGWLCTAIGRESEVAKSLLEKELTKTDFKTDLELAKQLALKVFLKISKNSTINEENVKIMTLKRIDNKIVIEKITKDEIKELLDNVDMSCDEDN
ncbi:proteasome subunit alpha type-4-like [Teleopsis dalmanni]|uniref:proteasome subunit alpha type-4-like n=1 Tax=Teleopsis dalmanni TaxID=139649 RepID=UPI0018CE6FA5|nr:proteasome subunit alpha type-4-like [Teleopsis dalmanni]XP_037933323.1 proteasome subunit alpha type-4-like [Teleopsis dalmanni]